MKGTIKVLDGTGHTVVEYDAEEGVVQEAMDIIANAKRNHFALFDGGSHEQVPTAKGSRQILEEHEELIVVPPMAGG